VLIDVEGHGREEIGDGLDVSRTLGWFTSLFPVRLDPGPVAFEEVVSGGPGVGQAVKAVKEQLRRLPDHGIGYGLLAYLNPDTAAQLAASPSPQIGFNYLGRLPAPGSAGLAGTTSPQWGMAPETGALGGGWDPRMPATHALEINSVVHDHPDGPRLDATWSWPGGLLSEADVAELAGAWFQALEGLVTHAARPGAGGHSPSDFALVNLSQGDIDQLEGLVGRLP
jgi:pristinamycin I synthase-2